jgi:hypothetical protein
VLFGAPSPQSRRAVGPPQDEGVQRSPDASRIAATITRGSLTLRLRACVRRITNEGRDLRLHTVGPATQAKFCFLADERVAFRSVPKQVTPALFGPRGTFQFSSR